MNASVRANVVAAAAAHAFNNELTVILSGATLLIQATEAGDPSRPLLVDIQKSAERCAENAAALLNFSERAGVRPSPASMESLME